MLCPDVRNDVRISQSQRDAAEFAAALLRVNTSIKHRPDITALLHAIFEEKLSESTPTGVDATVANSGKQSLPQKPLSPHKTDQ